MKKKNGPNWMCAMQPRWLCLCVCAILFSASDAFGVARMFLVRQGSDPNLTTPGMPVSVTINSGEEIIFDVFLDDSAPDNVKGFQITMPCSATGGSLGSVSFNSTIEIDNSRTDYIYRPPPNFTVFSSLDNGQCVQNLACTPGSCAGSATCESGICTLANPRAVAAVQQANGPVVTVPKYLSAFYYVASPSSSGQFQLNIVPGTDDSFLRRGPDQLPIPLTFDGAIINVRCTSNATCDDGSACTVDSCNVGTGACTNQNTTPSGQCCNPTNGTLTPINDNNSCTNDTCNTTTGAVSHTNLANGSSCGSSSSTQCDQPDTCQAGVCQANLRPNGFACGNGTPTHPQCDMADSCDGAGACLPRNSSAGTACGDSSDTSCTDPDTCNGAGQCVNNNVANGTPCNDNLNCNVGETCSNGTCSGGGPRDCGDGNQCTSDTCVEGPDPMTVCQHQNTTDVCDDGNPCTGTGSPGIGMDMCDGAGNCVGLTDPNCNLQCTTAVVITEGTNTGFSNTSASEPDDAEASCRPNSNHDVWFKFDATCSLELLVTTVGSSFTPSNDTVLSIYDACGGTELACDDDSAIGLLSAATFNAVAGNTYYIRVAGFSNNTGSITVNIRPSADDGCLIDGQCYTAGQLDPANECQICLPVVNSTAWTPLPKGTDCGDATDGECTSPDSCNGAGVCEANNKPDGEPCTDDANECTFDLCSVGVCSHPARPLGTLCGDSTDTECDNPDTCDGMSFCDPRYETIGTACGDPMESQCDHPDTCDGVTSCLINQEADGFACNDLDICTEADACASGFCVGDPIPEPPATSVGGPRSINITAQPPAGAAPVALLVTGDPNDPRISCLMLYVQADGSLDTTPVFQLPSVWSTIDVTGSEIIPSAMMQPPTTYFVQEECGTILTTATPATTALWGDVNVDGMVDIDDILCMLAGFSGSFVNCTFVNLDLFPCTPDQIINIDDILRILNAFSGGAYPCPPPCP